MFVQVIRARVKDRDAAQASFSSWRDEVGSKAVGWLGTTGGITDDGELVVVARFASQEAAQENSALPEQDAWFRRVAENLEDVRFADVTDVGTVKQGGSDDAGFVQVMEGQLTDVEAAKEIFDTMLSGSPADRRSDLLGGQVLIHPDGRFTNVFYFTSEAAAREGEAQPDSPEDAAMLERWQSVMGDVTYLDLRDPFLDSA